MPANGRPTVAIIGGGFTGATVAFDLASTLPAGDADIVVIEPRETLGAGLAYSSPDPAHRINVPADRMSLKTAEPSHFSDWLAASGELETDPAARASGGRAFPRRAVFGRYVAENLAPLLRKGLVVHRRDRVVAVMPTPRGFALSLEASAPLEAGIAVLATTHPSPAIPAALRGVAGEPGFIADVYSPDALDCVGPADRVLVVGNGLTAADTIAALDARGHEGRIVALSRRGLRSRGHAETAADPFGDFSSAPARSALALLGRVKAELKAARAEDASWHPVFDALREQAATIWASMDTAERIRLVRHLRVFWDAHRFRVAPQVEAVIDRRIAEGTLTITAGSLHGARRKGGAFEIGVRPRGGRDVVTETFDVVAVTTGPEHAAVIGRNPAVASLSAQGLVLPDPAGLGLETSPAGRAVGAQGRTASGLFVAGPLARGTIGELMGLPQVTRHAEFIAGEIRRQLFTPTRLAG